MIRTRNVSKYRGMTHAEKMAAKRADRASRVGFAERSMSVRNQVAASVAFWQRTNRRNGVGRPPLFKRYLVERSAA